MQAKRASRSEFAKRSYTTRERATLLAVLTDGGPEFQTALTAACRQLGIAHRRTEPRHAATNWLVERLQGSIVSELSRVAFRRTYYTSLEQLERDLQACPRFYNRERPRLGYRLKARTPAMVFKTRVGSERADT